MMRIIKSGPTSFQMLFAVSVGGQGATLRTVGIGSPVRSGSGLLLLMFRNTNPHSVEHIQ